MFFWISKVFWLVFQPVSIVLILLVAALVSVSLRWRRTGISILSAAVVIFPVSSFSNIGGVLIAPLEGRFERADLPDDLETILVLGGSTLGRIGAARGVTELNNAGDRFIEALTLARRFPQATVVFSGGTGTLVPENETEAESAERLFLQLGLDPARLVLEGVSRNTAENAAYVSEIISTSRSIALVTSGFHMPRSVGLFRAQGIEVLPWPTDYRSPGNEGFGIDIANPMLNLEVLTIAIREWIGLVAYKASGRIAEVFPGP